MDTAIPNTDSDRELLKTLMGKRSEYYLQQFDRIEQGKRSFNWTAFLFPMIVLLYRKQYGYFSKLVLPVCAMLFAYFLMNAYAEAANNTGLSEISMYIATLWFFAVIVVGVVCGVGFNKKYKAQMSSIVTENRVDVTDGKNVRRYKPSALIPVVFVLSYVIVLAVASEIIRNWSFYFS
jgi:hypothetical protein